MSSKEKEWMRQYVKYGDEQAREGLYKLYHFEVLRLAISITNDMKSASAVLRDAFMEFTPRRDQLDHTKPLGNFLFPLVRKMALHHVLSKSKN